MPALPKPGQTGWFYRPRPVAQPRLALYFFPYAGATAQAFRDLCLGLPADVEGRALQLPGRADRYGEKPFTRMEALLDALEELFPPAPPTPFAFFGHSLGTIISFELTRRFRRKGKPMPRQLFISGRRAPHLPRSSPIHALPDKEFLDELIRRYNGVPAELLREPELLAMFLSTLRSDFELYETWRLDEEAPLDVPFAVFGGLSDAQANRDHLEGWRLHTRAGFSLNILPGDHFFLQSARAQLLALLAPDLAR
jgi:medium-chain acyl-[acyl-carrier-protein] hydrolase